MTSKDDIRNWFILGKSSGHTHMLVVSDSFSYEDYPVYVKQADDVTKMVNKYRSTSMQSVREVYNLSLDMDMQLTTKRVWNLTDPIRENIETVIQRSGLKFSLTEEEGQFRAEYIQGDITIAIHSNKGTDVITCVLVDTSIFGVYLSSLGCENSVDSIERSFNYFLRVSKLELFDKEYTLLRFTKLTNEECKNYLGHILVEKNKPKSSIKNHEIQLLLEIMLAKGIPREEIVEVYERLQKNISVAKGLE